MAFSDRLKALRAEHGLTQEGLARAAGLSTGGVARLEHAGGIDPSWSTVVKLAEALGATPNDFLDPPAVEPATAKGKGKKGGGK